MKSASRASATARTRCHTPSNSGAARPIIPSRPATASVTRDSSARQLVPGVQPRVLVLPDDQHDLRPGPLREQRIARCRACRSGPSRSTSDSSSAKRRSPSDGQPHHRGAVRRRGQLAVRFLPRLAGRDPAHFVQLQVSQRRRAPAPGGRCAPDRSCRRTGRCARSALAAPFRAQSRGRRKSLVQRAPRACRAPAASRSATSPAAAATSGSISVRPPDCSPNSVPRSHTRLNST